MGLFTRKEPTRAELLTKAAKAQGRGNRKKAIELYRKVLLTDPKDFELHAKIAPLLALTKQHAEAAKSFNIAAWGYYNKGLVDKSIAIYQQAARHLPHESDFWERIPKLNIERNRSAEAVKALLDGSQVMSKHHRLKKSVELLRMAFDIKPWDFEVSIHLANFLMRSNELMEASKILDALSTKVHERQLRRVRALQFRLAPSLGSGWRWVRAALSGK